MATKLVPKPGKAAHGHESIASRLADRAYLTPSKCVPEFVAGPEGHFQFRSAAPVRFEQSNTVHGRFFPAAGEWQERATVVIVHGWNAELHYLYGCPALAKGLNKRGVNAILLELPFHLQRRPRGEGALTDFISDDLVSMLEAARQALADIEGLLLWARARGCPRTAVMGFSLGAWLAGLHTTESGTADAVALVTPVSDMDAAVRTLPFCYPIRAALGRQPVSLAPLNLTSRAPKVAAGAILTVESEYDLFVPHATCEDLARRWKLTQRRLVKESHLSVLASRKAMGMTLDWLQARLVR